MLRLEVAEFVDQSCWSWRLTDEGGEFIAAHRVLLDPSAAEYEGFVDLYRFVRWHADPERRRESEQALVGNVARWIADHVWGAVGEEIARHAMSAPVVVHILLSKTTEVLMFRPLELGIVDGRSLTSPEVSLVFELEDQAKVTGKRPISQPLRMLALFSVPTDRAALNARRERHELQAMVGRLERTDGYSIELRVLQYGVTRQLLKEVLAEDDGWDVIHFSGHGLPAGLVLERADGTADVVQSDEFAELLRPTRERLKLATLLACDSAAATAEQTLQLLGLPTPGEEVLDDDAGGQRSLPAVAQELVRISGCAVLAMRHPVGDDFAIALAQHLYEALLRGGQSLARALRFAVRQTAGASPSLGASPLSATAPALFGASALDLTLHPPRQSPGDFQVAASRLVSFPPEPVRFVGRVGSLARASSALAPQSRRSAVLFHGMAGTGKTACALELAYRHERRRFDAMAWYRAPNEGSDIDGALSELAISLELQLPELELVHMIADRERLEHFLPRLTSLVSSRALLLVLDNVESLLTSEGTWRDERWALLVDALIEHEGLTRVVLTSRHLPNRLHDNRRVLVEPIGSLSATESVLYAQQLPNLGRLIAGGSSIVTGEGRKLAREALEVAQGNPKLIDLIDGQAEDPQALAECLADVDTSWAAGESRLEAFFATGEPDRTLGPEDFMLVLEAWTRVAIDRLSEQERSTFHLLCTLEEGDRTVVVLDDLAVRLSHSLELPGGPPNPRTAVERVAIQGLIDIEPIGERLDYRIHPVIERVGRHTAGPDYQLDTDLGLANYWCTIFKEAEESEAREQMSPAVIHAGLAAVPYLLRLDDYRSAYHVLERALHRDRSAVTRASVLPYVERIVELAAGTPTELAVAGLRLLAGAHHHDIEGSISTMRDILEQAEQVKDFGGAHAMAARTVRTLEGAGRLEEALEMTERMSEHTRRAGLGPWTEMGDEAIRLHVLQSMGHNELVLRDAEAMCERMKALPTGGEKVESAPAWNVREETLRLARTAAQALGRFDTAIEFNRMLYESSLMRGATPLELADVAFDGYMPLIHHGRYAEVERLLHGCRDTYEAEGSRSGLANVFGALATLEDTRGRQKQAIAFARRSLRLHYALEHPAALAVIHTNLASTLAGEEDDRGYVLAHRLAAALIARRIGSNNLGATGGVLGFDLRMTDAHAIPRSFADLCGLLEEHEGVDFAQLCAALPRTSQTDDEVLREVISSARATPLEGAIEVDRYLVNLSEMILMTVNGARGDGKAREDLGPILAMMSRDDRWTALGEALSRILDGERNRDALLTDLRRLAATVVEETLAQLDCE